LIVLIDFKYIAFIHELQTLEIPFESLELLQGRITSMDCYKNPKPLDFTDFPKLEELVITRVKRKANFKCISELTQKVELILIPKDNNGLYRETLNFSKENPCYYLPEKSKCSIM